MDTNTTTIDWTTGLPHTDAGKTPHLTNASAGIILARNAVFTGQLQYVGDMFKDRHEWPIAHARRILAMCMNEELGSNKDRVNFLMLAFGKERSADLDHCTLSGLWHWLKPFFEDGKWHANETAGAAMRAVIREAIEGTWTNDDGTPSAAVYG